MSLTLIKSRLCETDGLLSPSQWLDSLETVIQITDIDANESHLFLQNDNTDIKIKDSLSLQNDNTDIKISDSLSLQNDNTDIKISGSLSLQNDNTDIKINGSLSLQNDNTETHINQRLVLQNDNTGIKINGSLVLQNDNTNINIKEQCHALLQNEKDCQAVMVEDALLPPEWLAFRAAGVTLKSLRQNNGPSPDKWQEKTMRKQPMTKRPVTKPPTTHRGVKSNGSTRITCYNEAYRQYQALSSSYALLRTRQGQPKPNPKPESYPNPHPNSNSNPIPTPKL
jgi:hypothetical protein